MDSNPFCVYKIWSKRDKSWVADGLKPKVKGKVWSNELNAKQAIRIKWFTEWTKDRLKQHCDNYLIVEFQATYSGVVTTGHKELK